MTPPIRLTRADARRLAVRRQLLAGPRPPAGREGIRHVMRALRCLQLDPISAVAPSHHLVLWSRLGSFDLADLRGLLHEERWLFEFWAHAASLVLTEDYPIHAATMRRYPTDATPYGRRVRAWMQANEALRDHILHRLAESAPLPPGAFDDVAAVPWESTGWTAGRNVERMLDHLWLQGRVMVGDRRGRTRLWALTEHCLPGQADAPHLPDEEVVALAAGHALRALGVATVADVRQHFTRDRYPGLEAALDGLESRGEVLRATVTDAPGPAEPWYLAAESLPLLDEPADPGPPRTTFLSPFDNLVCNRERTARLWDFAFRNEMYVPRDQRRYGYYVLPVLHGDRLVGRVAPRLDRRRRVLTLEGLYAEPDVDVTDEILRAGLSAALAGLAGFAGADRVVLAGPSPREWEDLPAAR